MENQFTTLRNYMERIAASYVPISHTTANPRFFENTTREIKDPAPGCIMYFSPPDFSFLEQDGSNIIRTDARITILRNFERANFPEMHTAIRSTFNDAKEILAKMKADRNDPDGEYKCLLSAMDLDDVSLVVDNVFRDGWIGCTIRLNLRFDEFFEITPAQWQ